MCLLFKLPNPKNPKPDPKDAFAKKYGRRLYIELDPETKKLADADYKQYLGYR